MNCDQSTISKRLEMIRIHLGISISSNSDEIIDKLRESLSQVIDVIK